MSMKHMPGGCCCDTTGVYNWYSNIGGPSSGRNIAFGLDTWHQDPIVCTAAVSCESLGTEDVIIPILKGQHTSWGSTQHIWRKHDTDDTYWIREHVIDNPNNTLDAEMLNNPGAIGDGGWTKGPDADASNQTLECNVPGLDPGDPVNTSDIYVEQTASGLAAQSYYVLRVVVNPKEAKAIRVEIEQTAFAAVETVTIDLDQETTSANKGIIKLDAGWEVVHYGQNVSSDTSTSLRVRITMIDPGNTAYTGMQGDTIEIVSVKLREYKNHNSGLTDNTVDIVRLELNEDYAHSGVSFYYPNRNTMLQASGSWAEYYEVDDGGGSGNVSITPVGTVYAESVTEYSVAWIPLSFDYTPTTEVRSGEANGIQHGAGFFDKSGVSTVESEGHAVGSSGVGFWRTIADNGYLEGQIFNYPTLYPGHGWWHNGVQTCVVRHMTPDVGGSFSLEASNTGLLDIEYPGFIVYDGFGEPVRVPSPEDWTTVSVGDTGTFLEGYAFFNKNPTKHPRIVAFAAHGFPRAFGVRPPEIRFFGPKVSPFYPDDRDFFIYSGEFEGLRLADITYWLESVTDTVSFHYGSPTTVTAEVRMDAQWLVNEINPGLVFKTTLHPLSVSGALYSESSTVNRLQKMDWSGFPFPPTQELVTYAVGKPKPSKLNHCYGQIEWADGDATRTLMIVTIAKLQFTHTGNTGYHSPYGAPDEYTPAYYASEYTEPEEILDTANSHYWLKVISNGVAVWSKEIFDDTSRLERAIGATVCDQGAVWFERRYTTDPSDGPPTDPTGWRMHILPGGTSIDTDDYGSTPKVVGSSKHFIFVSGFRLPDELTTGGIAYDWAISYDGNIQIPAHIPHTDPGDVSDSDNWPIRDAISFGGGGSDAMYDINDFTFAPSYDEYGSMGQSPAASKYPSRVP